MQYNFYIIWTGWKTQLLEAYIKIEYCKFSICMFYYHTVNYLNGSVNLLHNSSYH